LPRNASRFSSRKKQKPGDERPILPALLRLLALRFILSVLFACGLIVGYLDYEIRSRFSENFQSQPAHVYARAPSFFAGSAVSGQQFIDQLKRRGYRQVKKISAPGSYVVSGNLMDVYINAVPPNDQIPRAVRIGFNRAGVKSIVDHRSANEIDELFLEPLHIGSLQLGPYEDRITLKLHQMPQTLIKAVLAMEDRNFEGHIGIDPKGILRALWSNLREGRAVQGGSTLTQQLVKNLFLSPRRSLSRKAVEAVMAIIMEARFSKTEILEIYLNEVFLGQSGNRAVHGFALASEYYFGRAINQLKPHEISLLVAMIPAPSYYNPRRHPQRAIDRRNLVVQTLAKLNVISADTARQGVNQPLGIIDRQADFGNRYPAYMDYLHRQLRQYYSDEVLRENGLKLYTSLDTEIQNKAQSALSSTLTRLEQQKSLPNGSLEGAIIVADRKRGEILALVGGRVRGFSGFNRAIDAERPIGSLVKPAVYLSALEKPGQYSLATILNDSPLTIRPQNGDAWSPQNYDKRYRGPVPLYFSLIESLNVPTIRLGMEIGVDTVIETIHRLGVERDIANFPSTLLGANPHTPLEMAQLYQTLSNGGIRIPLRSIKSIHNRRGEAVAKFPLSKKRVANKDSVDLLDYALKLVTTRGTAKQLSRRLPAGSDPAGKTGTTDNFRDSWFVGYGGRYLAVVWIGRDDNRSTRFSGSGGALQVWINLMSQLDLRSPGEPPNRNIVFTDIDPSTGLLANYRCTDRQSLPFIKGFQPDDFAPCSGLAQKLKGWFKQ